MTKCKTRITTIDVHPDGDIILEIGSGIYVRFLSVSSGVLTAASGFFVELFSANLKENRTPCSAADPKHVPMDADDPRAMIDLCNLLHYRSEKVELLEGKQLVNLALLCYKYDCKTPVKLWMDGKVDMYFQSASESTVALEPQSKNLSVLHLMALAYLFDKSKQ